MTQLESKLDILVSLLESVTNSSDSPDSFRKILDQNDVLRKEVPLPSAAKAGSTPLLNSATHSSSGGMVPGSSINSRRTASSVADSPSSPNGPHNVRMGSFFAPLYEPEAQACLLHFRSYNLLSLPFIDIPPDMTIEQLLQDLPFFAYAVFAVSSPSIQSKKEYGKELKKNAST